MTASTFSPVTVVVETLAADFPMLENAIGVLNVLGYVRVGINGGSYVDVYHKGVKYTVGIYSRHEFEHPVMTVGCYLGKVHVEIDYDKVPTKELGAKIKRAIAYMHDEA